MNHLNIIISGCRGNGQAQNLQPHRRYATEKLGHDSTLKMVLKFAISVLAGPGPKRHHIPFAIIAINIY